MEFSLLVSVSCVSLYAAVTAQDTCVDYGLNVSSCTDGFPSQVHIEQVLGRVDLDTPSGRQVVIPAINFSCNGTITSWVIGALWSGNGPALTELQIWRMNSAGQYMKVNGTTINVGSENESEIYEVETSLSFQEGDVLGYFQPLRLYSELDLHLEDTKRIITYHRILLDSDYTPPAIGDIFTGTNTGDRYPLIAVRTDHQGCACGFMSIERVYALLGVDKKRGINFSAISDRQMIFPSIRFTCNGELVKLIMAGSWYDPFPQLQIWRSSVDNNMVFEKQNSSTIVADVGQSGRIYVFPVSPPLPFQPGDILGVWQPPGFDSRLGVYRDEHSMYYTTYSNESNNVFDISGTSATISTTLPLVTAVVRILPSTTIIQTTYIPHVASVIIERMVNVSSETDIEETGFDKIVGISVGMALSLALLIGLTVIIIAITLCLKQRIKQKPIKSQESVSHHSSNTETKTTELYDYAHANPPDATKSMVICTNESYGKLQGELSENVAYGELMGELSDNVAYGKLEGELSENVAYGELMGELSDNVAYGVNEMELYYDNVAYTPTAGGRDEDEENNYTYI